MKSTVSSVLFLALIALASCKKEITPVSGTINGLPAITLYGNSLQATDYLFIDTTANNKKISYNGVVYTYNYNANNSNIYILSSGTPAADGTLTLTGPRVVLTIQSQFSVDFTSIQYTSK